MAYRVRIPLCQVHILPDNIHGIDSEIRAESWRVSGIEVGIDMVREIAILKACFDGLLHNVNGFMALRCDVGVHEINEDTQASLEDGLPLLVGDLVFFVRSILA